MESRLRRWLETCPLTVNGVRNFVVRCCGSAEKRRSVAIPQRWIDFGASRVRCVTRCGGD